MESTARRIAEDLLSIRAVFFRPDEPFTWASGIKSPVYCDNRLILTAPDVRTEVETALMQTIRREYPDAEVLMGTSTAGIAHAAITAQMMGLPMGYVRSSSKAHGRQTQIEGRGGARHREQLHLRQEKGPGAAGRRKSQKCQPDELRRDRAGRRRTEVYQTRGRRPAPAVPE